MRPSRAAPGRTSGPPMGWPEGGGGRRVARVDEGRKHTIPGADDCSANPQRLETRQGHPPSYPRLDPGSSGTGADATRDDPFPDGRNAGGRRAHSRPASVTRVRIPKGFLSLRAPASVGPRPRRLERACGRCRPRYRTRGQERRGCDGRARSCHLPEKTPSMHRQNLLGVVGVSRLRPSFGSLRTMVCRLELSGRREHGGRRASRRRPPALEWDVRHRS
jgi:hypothetical protein